MSNFTERVAIVHLPFNKINSTAFAAGPPMAPAILRALISDVAHTATFDLNLLLQTSLSPASVKRLYEWCNYYSDVPLSPDEEVSQAIIDIVTTISDDFSTICLSCFSFSSVEITIKICTLLRGKGKRIIVGGYGITTPFNTTHLSFGEFLIKSKLATCVVYGDAEDIFRDVILNKREGIIRVDNASAKFTSIIPDYSDYDLSKYNSNSLPIKITGSKGCVRNCSFCDVNSIWPKYIYKTALQLFNEIQLMHSTHGFNEFVFTDNLINGSPSELRKLNQLLIDSRLSIKYKGQYVVRSKKSMPELDYSLMKSAGCTDVYIGIDSGSSEVRALMNKSSTDDDLYYTVEQLLDKNISQHWNIIIGFPNETDEDFFQSIRLLQKYEKYNKNITVSGLTVYQHNQGEPLMFDEKYKHLNITSSTNSYSSYFWKSSKYPTNSFPVRVDRYNKFVEFLQKNSWFVSPDIIARRGYLNLLLKKYLESQNN